MALSHPQDMRSPFSLLGLGALAGCAAIYAEDPPRPGEFSYGNDYARVCWEPVQVEPGGTMVLRSLRVNERGNAELRSVEVFGWVDADGDGQIDPNEKHDCFETYPSAHDSIVEFGEIRIAEASSARLMIRVDHSAAEPLEIVLR